LTPETTLKNYKMKKVNLLNLMYMLLVMVAISLVSCTKEGPAGKDGANGQDGEDGINGTDGTASCIQCHDNTQEMFARVNQWEHSMHATGETSFENGTSCAVCHTSQGFLERMANDTTATTAAIENPNMVNCYTCHNIHSTYQPADWAFTYADPVDYWVTGDKSVNIDFGSGNLCANCHQSRKISPYPVLGLTDTIYKITSFRYGPHHGPQSNTLGGFGAYELAGSVAYDDNPHAAVENGCIACHMAEAVGNLGGGHTMKIEFEEGGDEAFNFAGCEVSGCHSDIEEDFETTQAEIADLMLQLRTKLMDLALIGDDDYVLGDDGVNRASSSNPANLTPTETGAVLNYRWILEDKSMGIHNVVYAKALLTNSLEALN
jgi:hypothetical protein